MKNLKLAIVAISFGIAGVALAQAPSTAPIPAPIAAVRVDCAADMEKLCARKTGVEGHNCLLEQDKAKTLSAKCVASKAKADAFIKANPAAAAAAGVPQ